MLLFAVAAATHLEYVRARDLDQLGRYLQAASEAAGRALVGVGKGGRVRGRPAVRKAGVNAEAVDLSKVDSSAPTAAYCLGDTTV